MAKEKHTIIEKNTPYTEETTSKQKKYIYMNQFQDPEQILSRFIHSSNLISPLRIFQFDHIFIVWN